MIDELQKVIFLRTTNPQLNLSLEKHFFDLFYQCDHDRSWQLILWINEPCVVIGRFQDPVFEINQEELKKRNIPILRRLSGGGTVFHDLGNLNLSFLLPKKGFDKMLCLNLIAEWVFELLGIELTINPRGDLLWGEKKVSGNASKVLKDKVLFHTTLLISSDLDRLRTFLFNNLALKSSSLKRGIPSVRREVVNLNPLMPAATFRDTLLNKLKGEKLEVASTSKTVQEALDSDFYKMLVNDEWNLTF